MRNDQLYEAAGLPWMSLAETLTVLDPDPKTPRCTAVPEPGSASGSHVRGTTTPSIIITMLEESRSGAATRTLTLPTRADTVEGKGRGSLKLMRDGLTKLHCLVEMFPSESRATTVTTCVPEGRSGMSAVMYALV